MRYPLLVIHKIKFIAILLATLVFSGCINYYVGYFGYKKHKYRRYSLSRFESEKRKVFIKDLKFHTDSQVVENVYLEKAFKWGNSFEKTIILNDKTISKTLNPSTYYLYQVCIEHEYYKNGLRIYIPVRCQELKEPFLCDTLYYNIFLTDSIGYHSSDMKIVNSTLKNSVKLVLKVWE